jgi:hypothetical protein
MDHIKPQKRHLHSSRAVIQLDDLNFLPQQNESQTFPPVPYALITTSHPTLSKVKEESSSNFFLPQKQQLQHHHTYDLFICSFASLSLDIVADDTMRVRRSEQLVEVVLDVVVHADRQVPLCGGGKMLAFRLS